MLDPAEVDAALALDPRRCDEARARWTRIAALAVFGDLRADGIGALPRLRKRVLDLGERLRALLAGRDWIPQPRERLKNALASALAADEALAAVESGAAALHGGSDRDALAAEVAALRATLAPVLHVQANGWAALLARRAPDDDNA